MVVNGRKAQNIGHFNNRLVAGLLLDNPYSCIELSKKVQLTHTATGLIVDRLLNMDLIRVYKEKIVKRTKGRQHVRYEINPSRAFFVCLNLQYNYESLTFYDIVGKELYRERIVVGKVNSQSTDILIEKINECIDRLKLDKNKLAVISIAIPGRIDKNNGNIIVSSKVENVNLKEIFESRFKGVKIDVNNDIIFACTGSMLSNEFDYSNGSHIYTYCGAGLSCCLIYNGQIVTGTSGFAGEIGMNIVDKDGTMLYDVVSVEHIVKQGRKILKDENLALEEIINKSEDNVQLKQYFLTMADVLGRSIKNIINVTGCSHIVFSGIITKYPQTFFEEFDRTIKETNYSEKIQYKIDFSKKESAEWGQRNLSRINALDWVMSQY